METNHFNPNISDFNLDGLMGKLKAEDQRNLRISKTFRNMMWVMALAYLIIFLFIPGHENQWYHKLAGVSYATAFAVFALYFSKYYKIYSKVDYSLPTSEMLHQVVKRYELWRWDLLIIIVPITLIFIGQILSNQGKPMLFDEANGLWLDAVVFFGIMALSFGAGTIIWAQRQKPLRDNASKLIKELSE